MPVISVAGTLVLLAMSPPGVSWCRHGDTGREPDVTSGEGRRAGLRRGSARRCDHEPGAAVLDDVVAEHLTRALVGVEVERMTGVGELRRAVVARDGAEQVRTDVPGRLRGAVGEHRRPVGRAVAVAVGRARRLFVEQVHRLPGRVEQHHAELALTGRHRRPRLRGHGRGGAGRRRRGGRHRRRRGTHGRFLVVSARAEPRDHQDRRGPPPTDAHAVHRGRRTSAGAIPSPSSSGSRRYRRPVTTAEEWRMSAALTPESDELGAVEQAITALEGQRAVLGDAVVDTALGPLTEKRDRLLAASVGEQRKQVTVLFADMVDSTVLAARLDPEDLQQVMSRYFAALRGAVESEGGVVEKFIGDAVMAVFGLHRSREDDGARAVRAALAMLKALEQLSGQVEASLGVRLQMRIGIDTGEVVVTGLAERTEGEFLVVGDTANRAARLQAAAAPGTVLLSADTAGQVRGTFGLRRVPGLTLKGITGPFDAYLVVGADREGFWPESRGIEGVPTRTIGRGDEMRQLQEAFIEVAGEQSRRIVTVLGEAGVGKSRIVHDVENWLARLPTEVWVLRGRASPST